MAQIYYYYTHTSPWAFLGHRAFIKLAEEHAASVHYRPVVMRDVFGSSGALPLKERPKSRQGYRFVELQRWRTRRGLPLNLQPAFFPVDAELADRTVIALALSGADPADYSESVMRGLWVDELDIADAAVLARLLGGSGADPERTLADSGGPAVARQYVANTSEAIRIGVIGAPCYVLNGEIFWGQDRLDLLAEALESGREPYLPPE